MSKTIEVPSDLFQLIHDSAIPFVDLTPASVIKRWADFYRESNSKSETASPAQTSFDAPKSKSLNTLNPPDLLHTTVRGTFGMTQFRKWNELVRIAHVQARGKVGSFDDLRKITPAQIRTGDHEGNSGYHFVPEIGISVQGVDANHAWSYALKLAQFCKVPIQVQVEWRNNEKAAFPGENGSLTWTPVIT